MWKLAIAIALLMLAFILIPELKDSKAEVAEVDARFDLSQHLDHFVKNEGPTAEKCTAAMSLFRVSMASAPPFPDDTTFSRVDRRKAALTLQTAADVVDICSHSISSSRLSGYNNQHGELDIVRAITMINRDGVAGF